MNAPANPRTRGLAEAGGSGLLRLPCRAHKRAHAAHVPERGRVPLDAQPTQAQPAGQDDMGEDEDAVRGVAPQAPGSPSLAIAEVCRQTPKVGAVCGNSASTVLCGGTGVTRFPTAIKYARDEDGDGFCEVHVSTMEGFWSLPRSWLRPHRGISQDKLPLYFGLFQFVHNARRRGNALFSTLVAGLVT